jgi:hypothetical protein
MMFLEPALSVFFVSLRSAVSRDVTTTTTTTKNEPPSPKLPQTCCGHSNACTDTNRAAGTPVYAHGRSVSC